MTFFSNISILDWCVIGVLGALLLYQLYFYIRYMAGVQRRVRHQQKGRFRWSKRRMAKRAAEQPEEMPVKGVSVVVCARNEEQNLRDYLPLLLSQNYPLYELIVVDDASCDNTRIVLEHFQKLYPTMHITFVPADAWVRSTKKLGLTLAAKAAKYDYLLLTDADCAPASNNWITEMMHGFDNPATEVVLGYGGYFDHHGFVNRLVRFDTVFCAMQYLGMAMSRHPYMGVGRNLAYKKSTFFDNGGFQGLLGNRSGDDDLFVNKVATRKNTDVVCTPDSFTYSIPKATMEEWVLQKYRHLSVAPIYRPSTKMQIGLEPLTRGLWYLSMLTLLVLGILSLAGVLSVALHPLVYIAAAAMFVGRLTMQISMLTRAAHIFGVRGFGLNILFFETFLPLCNLFLLLRHQVRRKEEMKW